VYVQIQLVLTACLLAAPSFAQELRFAELGDFRLVSGEVIHDCRLGYRTFGKLNAEKSNAVLFPTWFTGTTENLVGLIGPGKLVDPDEYFVILADALGNGVSSSPSNSKQQPRMRFPSILSHFFRFTWQAIRIWLTISPKMRTFPKCPWLALALARPIKRPMVDLNIPSSSLPLAMNFSRRSSVVTQVSCPERSYASTFSEHATLTGGSAVRRLVARP
jgi:hypothetical protein